MAKEKSRRSTENPVQERLHVVTGNELDAPLPDLLLPPFGLRQPQAFVLGLRQVFQTFEEGPGKSRPCVEVEVERLLSDLLEFGAYGKVL